MITVPCIEHGLSCFSWDGGYCIDGAKRIVRFTESGIVKFLKVYNILWVAILFWDYDLSCTPH